MHPAGEVGQVPLGMTCAVVGEEPESGRLPETLATHIGPTVLDRGTAWSWAGSVGRSSMRPPALLHERATTSLANAGTGISTKAPTPKNSVPRFAGNKGSGRETKTEHSTSHRSSHDYNFLALNPGRRAAGSIWARRASSRCQVAMHRNPRVIQGHRPGVRPAGAESGWVAGGVTAARTGPQRCRRSNAAARHMRIPARGEADVGSRSARAFAQVANRRIRDCTSRTRTSWVVPPIEHIGVRERTSECGRYRQIGPAASESETSGSRWCTW